MTDPVEWIRRMADGPAKPPSHEEIIKRMVTGRGPVEPSAEMRDAALGLRGLYTAFREVGFSEDEAMDLVKTAMTRGQAQ